MSFSPIHIKPFLLLTLICSIIGCKFENSQVQSAFPIIAVSEVAAPVQTMIEGVSLVGSPEPLSGEMFVPIKEAGAEWVALLPYGFGSQNSTELKWNLPWQWWGETKKGLFEEAKTARQKGLKIMIKPQIWFHHGYYTGDYTLDTEQNWKAWEKNYESFILDYAQLADSVNADMFCIGTELKNFVQERPAFWIGLISKIKKVYSGPLTYAGNWDNFSRIPFWSSLDYIGIDAYFPLSESRTPSVEELEQGWKPVINEIEQVVRKAKRPVIFTEFGYKSVDFAAARPWEHRSSESVNLEAQKNGYEALFKVFYAKLWFKGGFLWNWYPKNQQAGGKSDKDFTPQNKPALQVTQKWYNSQP